MRPTTRAAVASGFLFALAFPPLPFIVPAFICLVPLAVALARVADDPTPPLHPLRTTFWMGAWFSVVGCGLNLYWIAIALSLFTWLASLGYVATVVGLSAVIGVATAVLYAARRLTRWPMAILLPVVWVTSELALLHLGDIAFPWLPLGLTMARHTAAAQFADVSGVHGLSAWIACTNGLFADAWLLRNEPNAGPRVARRLGLIVAGALAVCAYGVWRLKTTPLIPLARVTAIQPNIPEDEKMQEAYRTKFIGILMQLTRNAEQDERSRDSTTNLVVWPETALPDYLVNHPDWVDSVRVLASAFHTPVLFGVMDYEIRRTQPLDYDYFNAAMLADSLGDIRAQPSYRKRYLVPIVERVPFVNPRWFASLKYFGGFGRGGPPRAFQVAFGKVGVMICYESIFGPLARAYRQQGADLLLNITNDAWFGRTLAPYQHEAHLRLRAIETRTGVVRAANTGISEYIDPLGQPHGSTGLFVAADPTYDAQTTHVRTLYVAWGDWIGSLCVLATLGLIVGAAIRPLRVAREPRAPRDRER